MNLKDLPIHDITLSDIHDREMTLRTFDGEPLLLSLSSKDAKDDAVAWGKALEGRFGPAPVAVVRIVYLRDVPRPFRSMARKMLLTGYNRGRELYCDWKGEVHRALDLKPKEAHLVVVEADGTVARVFSGPPTDEAVADCAAAFA